MSVAAYPSQYNVFVPDHEATNKLVVDFGRNVKDFPVNKYTQIVPVKKPTGYYMVMTLEEAGRILNTDLSDFQWPDGAKDPGWETNEGHESFRFEEFRALRLAQSVPLGDLTTEHASWDIVAQTASIKARQMMTARTVKAITKFTTAGNYDASHTSAVASISGNSWTWAASTTARQDIKRSLNYAANVINKDTLGAIKPADLILVMSPDCALEISDSQEIVDYLKGSPDAYAYVKGDLADQNRNSAYGLPPTLYGYEVVIEDTVKVASRKGATAARSRVLASGTPFLCARPGGLEGQYGGPSFSTVTFFMLEEMTAETKTDSDHRRKVVRVVENYAEVMTAPVSGFLFTSAV